LHPQVIKALRMYFPHRRGDCIFSSNRKGQRAISRIQAWRILRGAAEAVGLLIRVSPHSLRKSFGYWAWRNGASPVVLMSIYNHSSYDVTKRYLGISQDEMDQVYLSATLF
jgi:Site-specific recombinase XerD